MAQPSERAKMLAGELYRSTDPELVEERRRAQHLLERYNATNADDAAIRAALLRQLFGAAGDGVEVQPRFACDYGYNIRIGRNAFINYSRNAFINYNCVFLDCASIEIGDDL
jgi:maltose O-acetyltransferase